MCYMNYELATHSRAEQTATRRSYVVATLYLFWLQSSLVPRPHPLRGKRGLVNLDRFLGLAGSVRARRHRCTETNLGSDWSVMLLGRGPTIQIYIAGNALCTPAVGESYDCAKAVISLECSNSFPWPEDCVQIHQTLFPRRGWGLGTRLCAIILIVQTSCSALCMQCSRVCQKLMNGLLCNVLGI